MPCTSIKPFLVTKSAKIDCQGGKYKKSEAEAAIKQIVKELLEEAEARCSVQGSDCFLMGGGELDPHSIVVEHIGGGKCNLEFGIWFSCGSGPRNTWKDWLWEIGKAVVEGLGIAAGTAVVIYGGVWMIGAVLARIIATDPQKAEVIKIFVEELVKQKAA